MDIYEPAEDSYLLQKQVRKYAFGRVLDVGTGSGIQALTAMKCSNVREVVAVDINEKAVKELNNKIKQQKLRKIKVIKSDLFEKVEGKFNLIIFNPPYLPQDKGIEDPALYGGKKGWEISERFFWDVSKYLLPDGIVLFLFSTLTNKAKIEEVIEQNLLEFKQIDSLKIAFEELFVYEIKKSELLRELEAKNIEDIHYFAKGRRGVIYTGIQDKSRFVKTHFAKKELIKTAIKIKRKESEAIGRIKNEAFWLKKLNKLGVGPKLLFSGDNHLMYKFVEGEFILDWMKGKSKESVLKVLINLLNQCKKMDKLKVNKEEMHHPQKHVLVNGGKVVLIDAKKSRISGILKTPKVVLLDFERCNETNKPKNVTQFVEFICRIKRELVKNHVKISVIKLRNLSKKYKKSYNQEDFEQIIKEISQ
jgi:release factor glutamine methyltransferase